MRYSDPRKSPINRLSAAVLLASLSAGTLAQSSGALEEIVVTAQKREQSLQDTPIAITAFGASELEQRGIKDLTDIGTTVPNVKIATLPSNTLKATIAIRGSVTSNPSITWEPTVGMYLDGVFVGKFSGNVFKVAELERIEVLRGPQGTLYGKNTTGGAVNMITHRPSGELGGKLRAGLGNFGFWETYGSLDLPALELGGAGELMAKVTLSKEERDGFYDNKDTQLGSISHPFTGQPVQPNPSSKIDFNAVDSEVGRLDLLWDVNERLAARYTIDKAKVRNTPSKPQFTDINTSNLAFGFPFPQDLDQYLLPEDKNKRSISNDADMYEGFDSTSQSLFVDYDFGKVGAMGDLSVKYTGNTRKLDFEQALDNDGTPFSLYHTAIDTDYTQDSHELQFTGSTERLEYVLGLFYFEEEADVKNPQLPLVDFFGPSVLNNAYGYDGKQKAVYGQLEWTPALAALQDRLTLTFGLRWTEEEKDAYISHPAPNRPAFDSLGSDKWTNTTPSFIVAYDLSENVNIYAKYSEGFKAGGFNGESGDPVAFSDGYDPETVKAYELGLKSRLLDNRLQVNLAGFVNKESDLQLTVFTSGSSASSTVDNVGKATKQGFEVEVIYQPIADLMLTANLGYLDSEYDEYLEFDPAVGAVVDKRNIKANQYAPELTYNLGAEYTVASAGWGEVIARLDYTYSDDYVGYINPEQNRPLQLDSYGLLSGRLSVADIRVAGDTRLNVALWGKNLTNEDYRLNGIPFGPFAVSYFGNPRTYGVEATLSF
ncbi:TonB-dependent receptor [Parahaliea sp. F7430]|uniref:TonB-dependent receptor n=1 Tax=Sediminihaliea albiluteola TaxID=2758564 RepID=A0A7W2TVV4_9GAMM|nr:TonB-dependent receptor [Sediminihaliea albiluteola]MBA6412885.1 TonB-dependent receptor [Sediminihaliea albiluteola]